MSLDRITSGAHHIGLTVPHLLDSQNFFMDTLGFEKVGEIPEYPAVFLSDGSVMITLWEAEDPSNAISFDRRNIIGLHHFALKVSNAVALEELHQKILNTDGCEIEFGPEPLGGGATQHMMCYIPGGIRTEFIAPAA